MSNIDSLCKYGKKVDTCGRMTLRVVINTQAQKAATYSAGVVLDIEIKKDSTSNDQVVRLYKFKNARVKKALSFKTKRNASKIA